MNTLIKLLVTGLASAIFMIPVTWAGNLTIPNIFISGTPASAAEMNANFDAVEAEVDDNDSRITALETLVATLQAQLAAVQNNSVLDLDGTLTLDTDANGYRRALFSGVNVQVVNGVDQATINGLGNLIVGYNNARSGINYCANGWYADQAACEGAGETWARSHKSGSHNLVAGDQNGYSQTGGVVFGRFNAINRAYAGVSGGTSNRASGFYSSVSGGNNNIASGQASSVSGGNTNTASGSYASVSGGDFSTAYGNFSSVSGGYDSFATGNFSNVSGGFSNRARGIYSSVSGGYNNTASGNRASVLGGSGQTASTDYQTIPALP